MIKVPRIATLYTLYGRRAGAELYFEKIIYEFSKQNPAKFQFTIFCNKDAEKQLHAMGLENCDIVYLSDLDNQYKKALWLRFWSQKWLQRCNADCFWIPSGTNHFPGKWKIPCVVTFHDFGEYHVKNKYSLIRTFYRKAICIKASIERGSAFTSVSQTTAKDLLRFWNKKSTIIYSGPSPHNQSFHWSSPQEAKQCVFEECGISLKDTFFFTPGRTDYIGKGLDTLFDAAETIPVQFILCGPQGEGHDMMMQRLSNAGNAVAYLGRVSERCMSALYHLCKAVVFPSRFEGFGFPVLEAFQHQRPIIVSNGGALPEVAADGGLIFEAGNSLSLQQKIEELMACSEQEIELLVQKGTVRLQAFSWERTVEQMQEIFFAQIGK